MTDPQTTIKLPGRQALDEAIEAKVTKSNLEYDAYTHGLCNGLLLARAILDELPAHEAADLFGEVPDVYYVDQPHGSSECPPLANWQQLADLADDAGDRKGGHDD